MVYKFTLNFTVRAASLEEAQKELKEIIGEDKYEDHVLVKEIEDTNQEVDVDLIKA